MKSTIRLFCLLLFTGCLPWLGASCLGDIAVTTSQATTEIGDGGGGQAGQGGVGGEECVSPPSGYCEDAEDCECSSCQVAAGCTDGGCMANGICDLTFEDTCICSDCDTDPKCFGLTGGGNCTPDGSCDALVESCACSDCFDEPTCLDNQALCSGGAPDGDCNPALEGCGCNDCVGSFDCYCTNDGICGGTEPCICNDCWDDELCVGFCYDPVDVCDRYEGCDCSECALSALCNGFPSGG